MAQALEEHSALSHVEYRQIIDAFIAKHLKDHYYAYAIHNKIGVMSDGQHHPHFE